MGDAYRKHIQIDGNSLLLDVLDTAGQEDFIALRTSWMRNKDGFVLAFSIIERKSFEDLSPSSTSSAKCTRTTFRPWCWWETRPTWTRPRRTHSTRAPTSAR